MPRTHNIKIQEQFAGDVCNGNKSFEVRLNDRQYRKGDYIKYQVVDEIGNMVKHPLNDKWYIITYVLSGWGLKDGYVAFAQKEFDVESRC